jgi:hypothetical protein
VGAVVALILLVMLAWPAYDRYQQRQNRNQNRQQALYDANNQTQINAIRINQQQQLVKVAKQQAQIRYQKSVGIREAQDEIAKTLTPLYIQFEAIQAQLAMAKGHNHTVIWLPSGDNGVPTVSTVNPSEVK